VYQSRSRAIFATPTGLATGDAVGVAAGDAATAAADAVGDGEFDGAEDVQATTVVTEMQAHTRYLKVTCLL